MSRKSDFEIWINKRKKGSTEAFLKEHPKAKLSMKNLNHNISVLIQNHKIRQRANDKFEWLE